MKTIKMLDLAKQNFRNGETIQVEVNACDADALIEFWGEHDRCGVDGGPRSSMVLAAVSFVVGMIRCGTLVVTTED